MVREVLSGFVRGLEEVVGGRMVNDTLEVMVAVNQLSECKFQTPKLTQTQRDL